MVNCRCYTVVVDDEFAKPNRLEAWVAHVVRLKTGSKRIAGEFRSLVDLQEERFMAALTGA